MLQTADEIRQEIDFNKQQLAKTMHQLEHQVEERMEALSDWRTPVYQYPLATVLASLGAGFLLFRLCDLPSPRVLSMPLAEPAPAFSRTRPASLLNALLTPFGGTLAQRLWGFVHSRLKK